VNWSYVLKYLLDSNTALQRQLEGAAAAAAVGGGGGGSGSALERVQARGAVVAGGADGGGSDALPLPRFAVRACALCSPLVARAHPLAWRVQARQASSLSVPPPPAHFPTAPASATSPHTAQLDLMSGMRAAASVLAAAAAAPAPGDEAPAAGERVDAIVEARRSETDGVLYKVRSQGASARVAKYDSIVMRARWRRRA
jgi:hypothetical protein